MIVQLHGVIMIDDDLLLFVLYMINWSNGK